METKIHKKLYESICFSVFCKKRLLIERGECVKQENLVFI